MNPTFTYDNFYFDQNTYDSNIVVVVLPLPTPGFIDSVPVLPIGIFWVDSRQASITYDQSGVLYDQPNVTYDGLIQLKGFFTDANS